MMANVYCIFELITGRKRAALVVEPYSNAILSTKNAIQITMGLNADLRRERI